MNKRSSGFTLVEILVVLGIIAILAALLFPAFGRAREGARQTNCQSNLQQISLAVQQYRKEEGRYPSALTDILGEGMRVDGGAGNVITLPASAPGYFRGGTDSLVCQDDDTDTQTPRSSYGSLSITFPADGSGPPLPSGTATGSFTGDYGKYVWNYWGLRPDGFAYSSQTEAAAAAAADSSILVNPAQPYSYPSNPIKYSMSNRYAPPSTVITHCVYHRIPTANNLNTPADMYSTDTSVDGTNAKEVVGRVEPSAKTSDISTWFTQKTWVTQLP